MKNNDELIDRLFDTMMNFYDQRIGFALRSIASSENRERATHRKNLCSVYITFLAEKINQLKLEL